jgi:hypothetical protein
MPAQRTYRRLACRSLRPRPPGDTRVVTGPDCRRAAGMGRDGPLRLSSPSWSCNTSRTRRRLLQRAWYDVGSWHLWTLSKRELPRTALIGRRPLPMPAGRPRCPGSWSCWWTRVVKRAARHEPSLHHTRLRPRLARILPRNEWCRCGVWMACRSARRRTALSRGSPGVHDRAECRNADVRSTAGVS